jgi:hypothetical protein
MNRILKCCLFVKQMKSNTVFKLMSILSVRAPAMNTTAVELNPQK